MKRNFIIMIILALFLAIPVAASARPAKGVYPTEGGLPQPPELCSPALAGWHYIYDNGIEFECECGWVYAEPYPYLLCVWITIGYHPEIPDGTKFPPYGSRFC